jgi:Rieske Fe-S protein
MKPTFTRRTALVAGAAGAVAIVAGCADGQSSSNPQPPETRSGTEQPGGTTSGGDPILSTTDVPVGGGVILADQEMVVTQPTAGTFIGLSSICTHQACPVNSVLDGKIVCPCHNTEFDLTGNVLQGPAPAPLPRRSIAVSGTEIRLG